MPSLNMATVGGNVGADPEIRSTQAGRKVASFRMATSDVWTDKASGERRERTEWHSIVVWQDFAIGTVERFVRKGSRVVVTGKLTTRKWVHADGTDRYTTEIHVEQFGQGAIYLMDRAPAAGDRFGGEENDRPGRNERSADTRPTDNRPTDNRQADTRQAQRPAQAQRAPETQQRGWDEGPHTGYVGDLDDEIPF